MTFIKNNIWTILSLAIVTLLSLSGDASAQAPGGANSTIEDVAISKTTDTFTAARNIMFVVGGFGLVAIAFAAIAGKMQWKWVGNIAIGLGIIAAASAVINYAITDTGAGGAPKFGADQFGDTLGRGGY